MVKTKLSISESWGSENIRLYELQESQLMAFIIEGLVKIRVEKDKDKRNAIRIKLRWYVDEFYLRMRRGSIENSTKITDISEQIMNTDIGHGIVLQTLSGLKNESSEERALLVNKSNYQTKSVVQRFIKSKNFERKPADKRKVLLYILSKMKDMEAGDERTNMKELAITLVREIRFSCYSNGNECKEE